MLLAIQCFKNQFNVIRNPNLSARINRAIELGIGYLESSVNVQGGDTFIGNRYSTPEALLALNELSKDTAVNTSFFRCAVVNLEAK